MSALKQDAQIILASTSFIRKEILNKTGVSFDAMVPDYDEEKAKDELTNLSLEDKAIALATGKALSISQKFPDAYVIGSDQICDVNDAIISKSKNSTEAVLQLKKLRGKTHSQNNAVVVAYGGQIVFKSFSKAMLEMRELSDDEIASYVKYDNAWGSAGSYKYESLGKHLFSKVSGDYHAILGFHIQPLLNFLHVRNIISIHS